MSLWCLQVSFENMGFDFIVAPKTFDAFYCRGSCDAPLHVSNLCDVPLHVSNLCESHKYEPISKFFYEKQNSHKRTIEWKNKIGQSQQKLLENEVVTLDVYFHSNWLFAYRIRCTRIFVSKRDWVAIWRCPHSAAFLLKSLQLKSFTSMTVVSIE